MNKSSDRLIFPVPENYAFEWMCRNSDWSNFPPFVYNPRSKALYAVHDLGTTVCRTRTLFNGRKLEVFWESPKKLDAEERNLLIIQMRRMLCLDWTLKPFHDLILKDENLSWIASEKQGWILRSASFFEDVVKVTVCANCTGEQGKEMLEKLVEEFGKEVPGRMKGKTFPSPSTLLKAGVAVLRERIKAGYRGQAIVEAAHRFCKDEFQETELRRTPIVDLRRKLLSLHGVTPSFVRYLMILLGRFDDVSLTGYCVTTEGKLLKSLSSGGAHELAQRKRRQWGGLLENLLKSSHKTGLSQPVHR